MQILKPVFNSLEDLITTVGDLAIAPSMNGQVNAEYSMRLQELGVNENEKKYTVVCLWGLGDSFIVHDINPSGIAIVDCALEIGAVDRPISAYILNVIMRCMLVGYVPVNLLQAISENGRVLDEKHFNASYSELINYVEGVVKSFETGSCV